MIMVHTLLNNESPDVIRYFRHLEYLATLWEKDREKYRPVLNGERYLTEAELSGNYLSTNSEEGYFIKRMTSSGFWNRTGWKPSIPISRIAFLPASHKKRAFFNSHQMNR